MSKASRGLSRTDVVSFSLAFNQLLYVSQGSTREAELVGDVDGHCVLGGRLGKPKPRGADWNSWPWAEPSSMSSVSSVGKP